MIYVVTLICLFFLIVKFDISPYSDKRNQNIWFNIMLVWFICVSGFAYNVGSDIPSYMREYDGALWSKFSSFRDLLTYDDQRQVGWILFELLCHTISSQFWVFKMIIAIFINWSVFRFIKRHSSYIFTSILFYAVILYLHLNFNALRQSVSVGLFLIGYDFLIDKKWVKYYLFAFLAYLFHTSAIILFIFPLFMLIKLDKKAIVISIIATVSIVVLSLTLDLQELVSSYLIYYGSDMADNIMYGVDTYFGENALSGKDTLNSNGIIYSLIQVAVYTIILVIVARSDEIQRKEDINLYLVFILFDVLTRYSIPVLFFRFNFYMQFAYIVLLPTAISLIARRTGNIRRLVCIVIITLFMYKPISDMNSDSGEIGVKLLNQYVPYYSIFNPEIDPVRSSNFGSHK